MTYDTAIQLAKELKNSEEFRNYKESADKIKSNETTKALLNDYKKLQIEVQSMMYAGERDESKFERLQKLGEVLQFNKDAAEYLLNELRLNRVIGDIYKIIADAVGIDLGMLDA